MENMIKRGMILNVLVRNNVQNAPFSPEILNILFWVFDFNYFLLALSSLKTTPIYV